MNGIRCRRGWNIPVTEATCFRDWNCILLGVLQSSHRTEKIMGKQQDYFSVTMRILQHPPFYEEFKKMERQFSKGSLTFKAGNPPKHEPENPIRSGIEAMEIVNFLCCKRSAKIKPILKMTGCYCPFCGVKNYEVE